MASVLLVFPNGGNLVFDEYESWRFITKENLEYNLKIQNAIKMQLWKTGFVVAIPVLF
jgi:hypothetical protein